MNYFKKFKNYVLGQDEEESSESRTTEASTSHTDTAPPGGFAYKREVPVPRQPVLQSAGYGAAGGVQGLDWYTARLKQDSDGDVADEFLLEPSIGNKQPPDCPLKVLHRNLKRVMSGDSAIVVDRGQVIVIPYLRR